MQNEVISLSEVLYHMDRGDRFDMEYVTADKQKGTGGQIKAMTNCILYSAYKKEPGNIVKVETIPVISKNPRHFQNSTRNIFSLADQKTRKVHLRLIIRFNGKRVS